MRRITAVLVCIPLVVASLLALPGCTTDEPVVVSREALGTAVSITAYGEDETAVRAAIDDAFAVMTEIAAPLDAYDPASETSDFNADPYTEQPLPPWSAEVLDALDELEVDDAFSPTLLAVSRLYDFEGARTVPDDKDLAIAVEAASRFVRSGPENGAFVRLDLLDDRLEPDFPDGPSLAPGLDFGGAAKGLALDMGRESLRANSAVTAALISSGSSTVTLGTKPDGSVWRIGVEDPRDTTRVVATFAFEADGALSTSGDYQRYFEAGGVRYHHILDPATGAPACGVRSLTVAGSTLSGLHSDILSTALFVRGAGPAADYASANGIALYLIDAEGRSTLVPAPEDSGLSAAEEIAAE